MALVGYIVAPAAAVATVYMLKKEYTNSKVSGSGFQESVENLVGKKQHGTEKASTNLMPQFAPQFDGLQSFETFISQ